MNGVSEVNEQGKAAEQQVDRPYLIEKPKKNRLIFYVLIVMVFC
jgi:hypothetical protein